MDDIRLGFAFRAARIRRRLRQQDLAQMAGVSDSLISRLEHGEFARLSIGAVRAIAARLGIRLDLVARWQGGELDRLVSARHAALGERVAVWIGRQPGWCVVAEVSFAIYGERGVVDLLAWHGATGSLVVIELKTAIVDVNEILGTLDRKRRLAAQIPAERGWKAHSVSVWLIVGDSGTNRRRVGARRNLFHSSLPRDGRTLRPLFRHPANGAESGICFWPDSTGAGIGQGFSVQQRVSRRRDGTATAEPRSASRPKHDGRSDGPPAEPADRAQLPPDASRSG